jgi:DNA-binding winged helix-turn-helix (wHTH) protein/TolB-like protein/tetratricopeptide (TPR) repeat protein
LKNSKKCFEVNMSDHDRQYAFGNFLLNPAAHELLRDGRPVPLSPKAFELLLLLVENHARLLEKPELMKALWPDTFVEEGNLCVMISLLRKALGEDTAYIKTVAKHGYRFVAEVHVIARQSDSQISHASAPEVLSTIHSVSKFDTAFFPVQFRWAMVGMLLAVIVTALILSRWSSKPAQTLASTKSLEIRSIAVLPFEISGAQKGDEYLGLGMADALITKLGSTGKIATRSTRAIQKYANTSQDPRAVGREQGVDAVLDGHIQRAGGRLRITAELIRVADGMQLWAGTFDVEYTNMFGIEDVVSSEVASSVRVELTGDEKKRLEKHSTTNNEAFQDYLRGRYFWSERTGEGLKKGLEYFKRAIDLDPNYAEAYEGVADSYAMLGLYTVVPPNEAFPKAKVMAAKALAIDNTLASAHATLGFVHFYYDWDGPAAEKEFATALQQDPNYAMAHSWRGFNLAVMGSGSEAVREAKLAETDDPLSAIIGTNAGWTYFLAGRSDEGIAILHRVIDLDPNFPRAHFRLGNIYEHQGHCRLAINEYEKAVSLSGGDGYYEGSLGHAYAMCGMIEKAMQSLKHLQQLSETKYVPPFAIALIYVGMGNKEHGLEWLERASLDRSTSIAYLRVDPTLNSLRSDPRFLSLIRQTSF